MNEPTYMIPDDTPIPKQLTLREYIHERMELMRKGLISRPVFKPTPYYSVLGDFVSIHFKDDDSYAETLVPGVELYRSNKTKEITGCQIWGIKELVQCSKDSQIGGKANPQ